MRPLLTTIGTRGDVQPLLALALELRTLGHEPEFCVPLNFQPWIESLGFGFHPYGPDVEKFVRDEMSRKTAPPTAEHRREGEKRRPSFQFAALLDAARDCDCNCIIVGGIPQIAAHSVADHLGIPCVLAAYCPVVLPSSAYPPPLMEGHHVQTLSTSQNVALWKTEAGIWNDLYLEPLNQERKKIGLQSVPDVLGHVYDVPVLVAADTALMQSEHLIFESMRVVQSADWILPDSKALPENVQRFLEDDEPPIFFGCGSMRANKNVSQIFIEAARSIGKRVIVSHGWSNLQPIDDGDDCLFVHDISYAKLFPHVAAVAYHGSAGTMCAAARAGRPQVVIPHVYDQFYLADRVERLGIGVRGPCRDELMVDRLTNSIQRTLDPDVAKAAAKMVPKLKLNGAKIAAEWLAKEFF